MPPNRFAITSQRGVVRAAFLVTLAPPAGPEGALHPKQLELATRDALELAAWLVVMAEANAIFYGDIADEKAIADDPLGVLAKIVEEIESGAVDSDDDDAPELGEG